MKIGTIIGVANLLPKPIMNTGTAFIKSHLLTTIDLTSVKWDIEDEILMKFFKYIPKKFVVRRDRSNNKSSTYNIINEVNRLPGDYYDSCIFKGTRIFLSLKNMVNSLDRGEHIIDFVTLSVFSTEKNQKNLKAFIMMLVRLSEKKRKEDSKKEFYFINGVHNRYNIPKINRAFDNVFIPQDSQDIIINSIDSFLKNKQWYTDHCIPYHFGILLYGPGGTGKSSIIQAIINKYDTYAYLAEDIMFIIENRDNFLWNQFDNKPNIIICEDIDTMIFARHDNDDDTTEDDSNDKLIIDPKMIKKQMLGKLLNFIDGSVSPSNTIYIFTTNYVDDLDEALIRPGRIDLKVEIGYIVNETMDKFLMFHYNKHLPEEYNVKPQLTFAELQTDVMRGLSFQEMIDKYTTERFTEEKED